MTDLIASISSGKGTIGHVERVIDGEEWERVIVITNDEFKNLVPKKENVEIIVLDNKKMLPDMVEDIRKSLKDKIRIMETAVNIISGEGKEHMALLSALLKLGAGIRLVAFTKDGVKEV